MAGESVPQDPGPSNIRSKIRNIFRNSFRRSPREQITSQVDSSPNEPPDISETPINPVAPPSPPTRTYGGLLPEGSSVQHLHADTKTDIEYGEKTWTTAQTVRDILQNHLDANTERFFDQLVSTVVDTDQLADPMYSATLTSQYFDEFTYALYRFKKGLGDFSPEGEKEMADLLKRYAFLLLREGFLDEQKNLRLDMLKSAIEGIKEVPPKISYKVLDYDVIGTPKVRWVTFEELKNSQDRFSEVEGIKIEDEGSGFDAKLSAFYKSTKRGQRHLRGKFGEGVKMSETHLIRHGAFVKMRSRFGINGGEQPVHERAWQHRAYVGEEDTIKQKGIQVDFPSGREIQTGSYTLITIDKADPRFKREFRDNVDPRIKNKGIGRNCLEYGSAKYYYPMSQLGYYEEPVGVSLEASPNDQYVQGLKVGEDVSQGRFTPIFSYDFLNSSVLQGRDRNELNEGMSRQIQTFWTHADSPVLVTELIRRVVSSYHSEYSTPEVNMVSAILSGEYDETTLPREPQKGRVTKYALQAFPSIVNAKEGTKNVIIRSDTANRGENEKKFITMLQSLGYNVLILPSGIGEPAINNLNKMHGEKYSFYSLNQARAEVQSRTNEMDKTNEKAQTAEAIFSSAFSELKMLSEKAGLGMGDFNIELEASYRRVVDPTQDLPFDLEFNDNTRRFQLIIRPELLTSIGKYENGHEYWKKRMQVEMLATFMRLEKFPDQNALYIASQEVANLLLKNTLHSGISDFDALPKDFLYQPHFTDALDAMRRFSEEQAKTEDGLFGWEIYNFATKFDASFEDMEKVSQNLSKIPEPYRKRVEGLVGRRVVTKNGEVGYFDYPEDGQGGMVFIKKRLDELTPVGFIEGHSVYKLGDKLFAPYDFSQKSVFKIANEYEEHTYVMYNGQLLDFGKGPYQNSFGLYNFNSSPIIEHGGFVTVMDRFSSNSDIARAIKLRVGDFEHNIKNVVITTPERKSEKDMKFLEGIIETPLPIEYGMHEWDNPVRIFQDIVQNHLDASPTGKIDTRFEVLREQQRVWITEQEITDSDVIVGFGVSDRGEGYTPNDIGTMGKSSKKSPLFAGKYGEGQKLIAAAAARNGFELRFSSIADYNGGRYRWVGSVGTQPVVINIHGKSINSERVLEPTNSEQVLFNITSNPTQEPEIYTSSTIIRLPEGTPQESKIWQHWLQVIDPRIKDQFGEGGLARYVLPMRVDDPEKVIDMGYMKILLDRSGEVYENGLLISTNSNNPVRLGYDVPEIVSTRERNSYDSMRLKEYIAHAAYTCPDPRYAKSLVQILRDDYLEYFHNPEGVSLQEYDLDFGTLSSIHYRGFVPAKPHWQSAHNDLLGSYLVHSDEALKRRIISDNWNLENLRSITEQQKQEYIKRIEQAFTALANVSHVPSDHIIYATGETYAHWSALFPTVEEFVLKLSEQEIPVSDEIHLALEKIVAASRDVIGKTQSDLRASDPGAQVHASIVTGKKPGEVSQYASEVHEADEEITGKAAYWDIDGLRQHQERVFVAPANAGYLGVAAKDRLGLNELLMVGDDKRPLVKTTRHELLHKIYGFRDYTPEFIMLLLESSLYNARQSVPT